MPLSRAHSAHHAPTTASNTWLNAEPEPMTPPSDATTPPQPPHTSPSSSVKHSCPPLEKRLSQLLQQYQFHQLLTIQNQVEHPSCKLHAHQSAVRHQIILPLALSASTNALSQTPLTPPKHETTPHTTCSISHEAMDDIPHILYFVNMHQPTLISYDTPTSLDSPVLQQLARQSYYPNSHLICVVKTQAQPEKALQHIMSHYAEHYELVPISDTHSLLELHYDRIKNPHYPHALHQAWD